MYQPHPDRAWLSQYLLEQQAALGQPRQKQTHKQTSTVYKPIKWITVGAPAENRNKRDLVDLVGQFWLDLPPDPLYQSTHCLVIERVECK